MKFLERNGIESRKLIMRYVGPFVLCVVGAAVVAAFLPRKLIRPRYRAGLLSIESWSKNPPENYRCFEMDNCSRPIVLR